METSHLELRALRRSFGEVPAVDGMSFSVPAGSVCGLVGRDGAGKTTTMRSAGALTPAA